MTNDETVDLTPQKNVRLKVAAALTALILISGIGAAAAGVIPGFDKSDAVAKAAPKPVITNTADVAVDTERFGHTLDSTAFGLSLETADIVRPGFGDGNFAALLRNLRAGVIRVGGDSVDNSFWTSTNEPKPDWARATVTPANIDALAKVAKASDWKVILSVNLKHFDPSRAADEVKYANAQLGNHLKSVAIGNEPSVYYPDPAKYYLDWQVYSAAIREAVPKIPIVGADVANTPSGQVIVSTFLDDQVAKPTISSLTEHHYSRTACDGKSSTVSELLSLDTYAADRSAAKQTADRASAIHVPGILDEVNSVSCEGQAGVSDVFASSLWSLAQGLASTAEGVRGVYFHAGLGRCGGDKPAFKDYTPLCAPSSSAERTGKLRAQPEYYGLMALSQVAGGQFVTVKNPDVANLRIFAIRRANQLSVVIINVRPPAGPGGDAATMVSLTGLSKYKSGESMTLRATSNDGLTARNGISFADRTVRDDGTFPSLKSHTVTPDANTWKLPVHNGSAVILALK